jgi:prepilin-type N-terminal cleavage/methylation domain-containing protein
MNVPLNKKRGMTLVEVLTAVAIFVIIIAAVYTFEINIFSYNGSISSSFQTIQDSQTLLKTMLTELREAVPGVNGSYSLSSVGSTSISFFSDSDNDGTAEQITYSLVGTTLYRSVIKAAGSPLSYSVSNQSTSTLIQNLRNGTSTALFQYFDANYTGTSSPLTQPVTPTAVRLIKISIVLDSDPTKYPAPITYTTQVNIRNLKDNL